MSLHQFNFPLKKNNITKVQGFGSLIICHCLITFFKKLKQHIQNIKNDNELSSNLQIKWAFLKYKIQKFIRFSKMRAKEERKLREKLEITLKLLEKTLQLRKINLFTINVNKISKKYTIILRKPHASEAGVVSAMKKVKNPLNFS